MIVIAGTVEVLPDQRQRAIDLAAEMAAQTRTEPGCNHYAFYSDVENPNRFHVFEEWESLDALRRHFETTHMAQFNEQISEVVAGPFDIHRYDVSRKTSDYLAE